LSVPLGPTQSDFMVHEEEMSVGVTLVCTYVDSVSVYLTTFFQLHKNSVALVRKQIIPTERPPLVDEVSANFSG
jgi:hypothetical protein